MHHIIYMSRATRPMNDDDLGGLLHEARQGNERQNITGALVYGDGQFMQIIEGEEAELVSLYARLLKDPRHERVVKLADKQIAQRSFSEWSMAFQTVSPEQFSQLSGYMTPEQLNLEMPSLSAADTLLLQMMKTFVLTPRS